MRIDLYASIYGNLLLHTAKYVGIGTSQFGD